MKKVMALASLIVLLGILYLFNGGAFKQLPPLGPFLNPYQGFWMNAHSANFLTTSTTESVAGLQKSAKVVYDSLLIPHIYAENEHDLFFLQGYTHARHRLWQMDFTVRATMGRLAEILGPNLLSYDRFQRRKGLFKDYQAYIDKLLEDEETKTFMEAYTAGVNAYIEQLDYAHYPLEFKLMNYKPEPWTVGHTISIGKQMSSILSSSNKDFEYTKALSLLGAEVVDLLYPDNLDYKAPIVSKIDGWDFKVDLDSSQSKISQFKSSFKNRFSDDIYASNNWAVDSSKTGHYPILANDPHLRLGLPSVWFANHLETKGYKTQGVSLPGVPGVLIGFNSKIAWGKTNAQRDVLDWYEITFHSDQKLKYKLDDEWLAVERVAEVFEVKDGENFYDTILYTHWGPIVNDDNYEPTEDGKYYAMKWLPQQQTQELKYLYRLNKSLDYATFKNEALPFLASPGQNVVFASTEGEIAMHIQGKYPIKRAGQGKFVLDGSQSKNDWQGYIPQAHQVYEYNPKRGFVSSANQYHVDSTYPYHIFHHKYERYRGRRLNQLLASKPQIDADTMKAIAMDDFYFQAAESLPFFLTNLNLDSLSEQDLELVETFKAWDFKTKPDQTAAGYYAVWWKLLNVYLWDELRQPNLDLPIPQEHVTIHLLKKGLIDAYLDILETEQQEDLRDLLTYTFKNILPYVATWKSEQKKTFDWGNYKNTTLVHMARLEAFSVAVRTAGGSHILNATRSDWGPSWRMVVELNPEGITAQAIYPGGQDGNPASFYYDNFVSDWAKGNYRPLHFGTSPDEYRFFETVFEK